MNLYQLNSTFLTVVGALFLVSCGGGRSQEQAQDSEVNNEFHVAKSQVVADITKVLDDIPPPSEVPFLLMQAGADYNPDIISTISHEKIEKYQKKAGVAALNLGIYATDIAYFASYEQSEPALTYMGECQKLTEVVGISDAIDYSVIARFEDNMENKDSLAMMINQVVQKSSERLSELNELSGVALMLAGTWIEGIYLSTTIVSTYPDDLPDDARTLILEPLVKIVIDQKTSLNDLLKLMEDMPASKDINSITLELKKVKAIYDGELEKIEEQIVENTGDFVLKPSTLDNLATEVSRIRASIVN